MPELTPLPRPEGPPPLVTPAVLWIVAALGAVHFVQWTLVQPADVQAWFSFRRGDLDVGRWWAVATYSLAHPSLSLVALNVYALALFGPRLERFWGTRRFVGFAALAALGGWIAHLFVGGTAPLLGASAVAFGVMGAHALRWGGEERALTGGFTARSRWIVAFVGAVVLLTGIQEPVGGGTAFLAHLGGLGAAWAFARAASVLFVERFRDGVSAMPDDPPDDQPPRAVPKTLPRSRAQRESIDDVVARSNEAGAQRTAPTRRRQNPDRPPKVDEPPTIDEILDKISAAGLDGLTPDERRVLDDHSRRLRDG
ncbi:MAG: rhomboid family intramembrane serine protease [Gemmatimonadaceae bacterium]